jgi:hypothetical protein
MITQSDKRKANLSILQKLRQQGAPVREDKMDSMFDSISPNGEDMGDEDVGEEDIEDIETAMGEKEKKKGKKLTSPPSIF